jgi:hypothetical protein
MQRSIETHHHHHSTHTAHTAHTGCGGWCCELSPHNTRLLFLNAPRSLCYHVPFDLHHPLHAAPHLPLTLTLESGRFSPLRKPRKERERERVSVGRRSLYQSSALRLVLFLCPSVRPSVRLSCMRWYTHTPRFTSFQEKYFLHVLAIQLGRVSRSIDEGLLPHLVGSSPYHCKDDC